MLKDIILLKFLTLNRDHARLRVTVYDIVVGIDFETANNPQLRIVLHHSYLCF